MSQTEAGEQPVGRDREQHVIEIPLVPSLTD